MGEGSYFCLPYFTIQLYRIIQNLTTVARFFIKLPFLNFIINLVHLNHTCNKPILPLTFLSLFFWNWTLGLYNWGNMSFCIHVIKLLFTAINFCQILIKSISGLLAFHDVDYSYHSVVSNTIFRKKNPAWRLTFTIILSLQNMQKLPGNQTRKKVGLF